MLSSPAGSSHRYLPSLCSLFRLLNTLGNLVILTRYDVTKARCRRKYVPRWRRFANPIALGLIYWTYPQAFEQKLDEHLIQPPETTDSAV